MFNNFEFANPEYLFLLIVIPLLGLWYWYRHRKDNADLQVSTTESFEATPRSIKQYLYFALYVFRAFALGLLIVALARPQSTSRDHRTLRKTRSERSRPAAPTNTHLQCQANSRQDSKN